MPLGRCGGMYGRGAPPAIDGRPVPVVGVPPAFPGVLVGEVGAAGVGAWVGAVMRVDGVSVRVGRGGVDGAGVGDATRGVVDASSANERAALGVANDCAPSIGIDDMAGGCVVAVLESGDGGGGLPES